MKFTRGSLVLLLGGAGVLLFFFVVKCLHLQRSDYTGDMFTHYQLSRDWFYGKPLFYENSYGYHSRFHNYFIDLLLSAFTLLFGVYGLFVSLFSLLLLALYRCLHMLQQKEVSWQSQLLLVTLLCSPLSYFVLHDEHYGFHAEILFFPLSILLMTALSNKSRWALVWALLLILVKEDGAALLWCCGMLYLLSQWHQSATTNATIVKKSILLSVVCIVLFVAGFVWLKHMNAGGETRMGWVMQSLKEQKGAQIISSFLYLLGQRAQLTLPILLLVFLYTNWKFALGSMVLSIPVLLLNFISGTLYFDETGFMIKNYFSLLWCPRTSMYWGYWMGVVVLALTHKPPIYIYPKVARTLACMLYGLMLYGFQGYFFIHCDVTKLDIVESVTEAFLPNREFVYNPEFADAAAIAKELPKNYPVAPMYRVFGAFHKQDIIWLNALQYAYFPPRMILASYNKDEIPDVSKVMQNPYFMLYHQKLHIYCEAADTVYVNKAGLKGKWEVVSGQ